MQDQKKTKRWITKHNKTKQAAKILRARGFDVLQILDGQVFDILAIKIDEALLVKLSWPGEKPDSVPLHPAGIIAKELWHFPLFAKEPEVKKLNEVWKYGGGDKRPSV